MYVCTNATILQCGGRAYEKQIRFWRPDPEAINLFSCSTHLSMEFQLLINVEIVKVSGKFWFKTQKIVIYPAHEC